MGVNGDRLRNSRATALSGLGLLVNMAPIGIFASVLPEITAAWGRSAAAGWIGGIYFAGYVAAFDRPAAAGIALDLFGGTARRTRVAGGVRDHGARFGRHPLNAPGTADTDPQSSRPSAAG